MDKPLVAIVMGSDSDLPVMNEATLVLKEFKIPYEIKVLSAHRTPRHTLAFVRRAQGRGIQVLIAGAGGAAHLAGVSASHTTIPVIGVPLETQSFQGIDSLLSTVQMPAGVPVACMAIGKAGARNAALFAIEILSLNNPKLHRQLIRYRQRMTQTVLKKNAQLR